MTGELLVTPAHRPDCRQPTSRLPWRHHTQPRRRYLSETYELLCGGYAWQLTCETCGQQTVFRVTADKHVVPLEGTEVYGTPANIHVLTSI